MTTISSTATHRDIAGSGFLAAVGRTLRQWWRAHLARRREQAALLQLRSMSDRELNDIGIHRSQVEFAVRGERDHALRRTM